MSERQEYRRNYRLKNPKAHILHQAKHRALRRGIPFTITVDDIPDIPVVCPVLGIALIWTLRGKGGWYDDSPSLDRIINDKGYVPGNVRLISNRANRLKADATVEELKMVYDDARSIGS